MAEPLKYVPGVADGELPYRLELWDERAERVERVLALSSTGGIAYAAYYAAVREHLGRRLTLSRDGRVLAASGARRR